MEARSFVEFALRVGLSDEFGDPRVEEDSEGDVDDVQVAEELEDWRYCFRRRRKGESRV